MSQSIKIIATVYRNGHSHLCYNRARVINLVAMGMRSNTPTRVVWDARELRCL